MTEENNDIDKKVRKERNRFLDTKEILKHHKDLIWNDEWAISNTKREEFIDEIKTKIEDLLK